MERSDSTGCAGHPSSFPLKDLLYSRLASEVRASQTLVLASQFDRISFSLSFCSNWRSPIHFSPSQSVILLFSVSDSAEPVCGGRTQGRKESLAMDFGAVTAKKFSNGYGVSGKSAYDGVFASPVKFRVPSFSSTFEDYCEIFGGSEASLGSSIPVLEVPELNERKISRDIQRSKLDYSKVFGGFGNLDSAVPYEELFAEPKKKDSFPKGASSQEKRGNQSSKEDSINCSKEIPLVLEETSSSSAKKINMSYHKINQGSENRKNGTTHIAQLHVVPAYTCLIEEVNPSKINRDDKSIPVLQHACPGSDNREGIKESRHFMKSVTDPSPDSSMKQSSNGEGKVQDRSDSIHMFFNACEVSHGNNSAKNQSSHGGVKDRSDSTNMFFNTFEVSHGSDGTDHIKVPTSQTVEGNLDNHGHTVQSMATKYQESKNDASEVAAGADSPLHLDDMVDSNSEAAASMAALRKAIEEAQERLKVAKDLMKRKKEGFPDRVKWRFNNDLKTKGKKEDKFANKTVRRGDALPQMSSVIRKPMMGAEQVTLDHRDEEMFIAKEAASEALEKLESTLVEHKEADHKEAVLEFKDVGNNKETLYTVDDYHWNEKNAGNNAIEKPEESHQTTEVAEGPCEQEVNEGKVNAGNEAGGCEEPVDEMNFRYEELVDDIKLAQETLSYGAKDMSLKVEEDEAVTDNKAAPFLEQEDCERKLGEQGLSIGNEKEVSEPEDEKKVEGSCEQQECSRNLRDHQGLIELKKEVTQEQIESKENITVFSLLKECALREIMGPIDNDKLFNMHGLDLTTMERKMENLGCVEEGKKKNEVGFLDLNQEIEHCHQREGTENSFGNIFVLEMLEDILGHVNDEEGFHEIMTKHSDSDGDERVQDAIEDEMELEGATHLTEENEKHSSESVEVMKVTENGPNYEEKNAKEAGRTIEISPNKEPDEGDNLSKSQVTDRSVECDKIPEVTPEGYSHNKQDDKIAASNASAQHEEKNNEPESVQEVNDLGEKHTLETSTLAQVVTELKEEMNQMQYTNETVSFDSATNIGEPDEKVEQNQDDCFKEAENNCNLAMLVEEPSPELIDIYKYTKEAEDALNAEIDENQCNSSNEEILVDNEINMEASQPPGMPEWKSSTFDDQEMKRTHSKLKENHQAMGEKKANDASQKVELETDHLKKIEETKERQREREKEKEKIAVERAIREARERAFAEARERAAMERAATEARRKNISDGRERLGKTTGQANEMTSTERAAMEAKLKAERAAVERATAEARARALERALSEKAASEARNKSEKSYVTSRDNGMRPNFHSKSFTYGDTLDGANGESAQRCKARSERHQRIGERVAKALAEKNARDRLVQKEQEERHRVAEALDADVKRWSSGKEGNLRALLSTLQYILRPESGWQPIHLTDIVNATAVKKAYRKATLFVHPDKLQQRGASIQQKYTCEKVFDLLKEAWNKFNMEER